MKYISLIRKIMLYVVLATFLLLVTASTLTYIYKDKIINLFVQEVNKNLRTPVNVEKIGLSLFEKFPHLSVSLNNVFIQESIPGSALPLAEAKHIYCTFSLIGLLKGEYTIKQIFLEDAEVYLKVDKYGANNFTILNTTAGTSDEAIAFHLEKISLDNVLVNYTDEKRDQQYIAHANDVAASLKVLGDLYDINVKGSLISKKIQVEEDSYFREKPLYVDTWLIYDDKEDHISIKPSTLKLNNSAFSIDGFFSWKNTDKIDLNVEGQNTDVQTILSLLPERLYNKYKIYTSKGEVYFNGNVKGEISRVSSPAINISFGCNKASFSHPDFKKGISDVTLIGSFKNPKLEDLSSAVLELKDVEGVLEEKKFSGNLIVKNFKDYHVKGNINAELNLASLLKFYPIEKIKSAEGMAMVKMSMDGRLNDLKNPATTQKLLTAGEIILKDINLKLTTTKLPLEQFNGSFIFHNNDLGISDFSGNIGSSQFLLNGYFKNIIAFLAFKDQPITIEADLSSRFLDFNELLSGDVSEADVSEPGEYHYAFEISPKLQLLFNCDIDKINFRRFNGKKLKGQLKVKSQIAEASNVTVHALGGKMGMNALVDASKKDKVYVKTVSTFDRIDIDSIFYVFQNFNQDFLVQEHLKGQIFADVKTFMLFDSKLRLDPSSITSDLEVTIKNGQLNNFAPLQSLSRFVEEKSLARLRFSELKNVIHIEKEKIFLPPMEIRSNVTTILISGTHTFDQKIDYHLQVPLRSIFRKVKDDDGEFAPISEDELGNSRLFLTIKGTTDDYKIGYDTEAVKRKIKNDIKNEGRELKEIFKNKGKPTQEKQLEEDEYFDF